MGGSMRRITTLLSLFSFSVAAVCAQDFLRWNANIGAGPTFGLSDSKDRLNTGFNITGGGGINFNRYFGLTGDFIFNDLGLSDRSLQAAGAPGGFAHLLGFSVNPVFRIAQERKVGGYLIGGYGIFKRTVNLTRPEVVPVFICDPWTFFCYEGSAVADVIYRSNSTWKGGWNIGGGVTYRLGDGNAKLYAEVRYYEVLTSPVKTTVLPLTFGIRW